MDDPRAGTATGEDEDGDEATGEEALRLLLGEAARGLAVGRGAAALRAAGRAASSASRLAADTATDDAALLARLGPALHRALTPGPSGDDTARLRVWHEGHALLLTRDGSTWYVRGEGDPAPRGEARPGEDLGLAVAVAFLAGAGRRDTDLARADAAGRGARLLGAARDALWTWPAGADGAYVPLVVWRAAWRAPGGGTDAGYTVRGHLGPGGTLRTLPARDAAARILRLRGPYLPLFERLAIRGPEGLPMDLRDRWGLSVAGVRRDPDGDPSGEPRYLPCDLPRAQALVPGPVAPPRWGRARLDRLAAARAG